MPRLLGLEVRDHARPGRIPRQRLLRFRARGLKISTHEVGEKAEVGGGCFSRFRNDRHIRDSADRLGDRAQRNSVLGDCVIPASRCALLERQSEKPGGIEAMHCRPAVESTTHVCRDSRVPCRKGGIVSLNGGGDCFIVGGHFTLTGSHAEILLGMLPPIVHLRSESDKAALRWSLDRMRQEVREQRPGAFLVTQHLAYMMLVQALRLYLEEGVRGGVGWLCALADKQMSVAISVIHDDPAHHWTLQALAERVGMSRSIFAEKFKATVGVTPMEYLTRWRMLLAADRLTNSGDPISVIATSLGYESESAFSKAFKRVMGRSPRQYARAPDPASSSNSTAKTSARIASGTSRFEPRRPGGIRSKERARLGCGLEDADAPIVDTGHEPVVTYEGLLRSSPARRNRLIELAISVVIQPIDPDRLLAAIDESHPRWIL
jgi:AraC-like DNA-binding protein